MSLIRRDLILFERTDLKVVRKKIRRGTVRVLISATPNSVAVVEGRAISPHIYRIKNTHSFIVTRSGALHDLVDYLNLTLEEVHHFKRDGDNVVELLNGEPVIPNEILEIRAIKGRMAYARKHPPVYEQEED